MEFVGQLKSIRLIVFPVLFLVLATGCDDGRGKRIPIGGQVTIDGQPLAFGAVTFMPVATGEENSRAGGGSLDAEGRFHVSSYTPNDGLMVGKYQVMVNAQEPLGETSLRWHAPKKYSSIKTSGLTAEVTSDSTDINFQLSWEGEEQSEPFIEKF